MFLCISSETLKFQLDIQIDFAVDLTKFLFFVLFLLFFFGGEVDFASLS